jgi:hypothetical protein
MKEHQKYLGLCLPYALGRLNPRNKRFFESHLNAGCEHCNRELAEIYEAMSLIPLTLPQQQAPTRLKDRVIAAARKTQQEVVQKGRQAERAPRGQQEQRKPTPTRERSAPPQQQRPWFGYAMALVIVVILAAMGWYMNSLITRLDEQEQRIIALTHEVQVKEELLKVLQAPRLDMVIMNGLEPSPAGYGKIIWDPEKKVAIFHVANLPETPADKDYQLWVIKDNQPVSAGVFSVQEEKDVESYFKILQLDVAERKDINAFAVTLEPKGGLPQPSGPMYLLGSPAVN